MFFYQDSKLKIGRPDQNAELAVGNVDVEEIARAAGRPVYIYDLDDVERRFQALEKALCTLPHMIHYAMKANSHEQILRLLGKLGAGVDTVSGGEIKKALQSGIQADRIIFSGVAKTVAEIEFALQSKIKQINVESPEELLRIQQIARRLKTTAPIAFRLNPDVSPNTHPYITTGFRENKFGMDESFIPELLQILGSRPSAPTTSTTEPPPLQLRGLTMHIGSLLFDLGVIREAILKTVAVQKAIISDRAFGGHRLDRLDIGGGLGINYETADDAEEFKLINDYGRMAIETLTNEKVEVLTEPGRIIVGRSGLLVGEVQYIKKAHSKTFAILNTGMNHLLRPALYQAKHRILPLSLPLSKAQPEQISYDVVGPICESSDFFAKNLKLTPLKAGDFVGIADAGAYGFSMASQYNLQELPLEIFVSKGRVL
jgi:diaminopimelate decarboxylase